MPTKLVVVTGGSLSGLGKGTCASSIGVVLRSQGYRVTAIKIDPYLNVDAGTISPGEHGEVFVLKDGHEGDLDLGNYERALDVCLTKEHNITTGKIYNEVIKAERRGEYLGATVQVVPHVTNCIRDWITLKAQESVDSKDAPPDICLVEVGGTVGDIESSVYLEALCQMFARLPVEDRCLAHLTYLPTVGQELKTKPSQHSFRALREAGLKPDFVMGRAQWPLQPSKREKLSTFSGVPTSHVFSLHDVKSSYLIPKLLIEQEFHLRVLEHFHLPYQHPNPLHTFTITPVDLSASMALRLESGFSKSVKIAIVAKYLGNNDTYLSIVKSLEHASCECCVKVTIVWIDAEALSDEKDPEHTANHAQLRECDGIIVPGGFGGRGVQGKLIAAKYARENKIPYLGICYGLHIMLIEGAMNLLKWYNAQTEEIDPHADLAVIVYMPETINKEDMGGTMRLGSRPTMILDTDSISYQLYDRQQMIHERHRHRYEVNTAYKQDFEGVGYRFVGTDGTQTRMEIVEYKDHPFMIGVQYHPEFTSKVAEPNPCLLGLVLASAGDLTTRLVSNGGLLLSGIAYGLKCNEKKTSIGTSTTSRPVSPSKMADTTVGGQEDNQENVFGNNQQD